MGRKKSTEENEEFSTSPIEEPIASFTSQDFEDSPEKQPKKRNKNKKTTQQLFQRLNNYLHDRYFPLIPDTLDVQIKFQKLFPS